MASALNKVTKFLKKKDCELYSLELNITEQQRYSLLDRRF